MPARPKRPCAAPGCGVLVRQGRCSDHTRQKRQREDERRGSRQSRGYDRDHEKWREKVLNRDAGLCQPCCRKKTIRDGNTADHIIPFDQGGAKNDPANGQAICATCHGYKTAWEREHDANVEPWPETEAGDLDTTGAPKVRRR